MMGTSSAANQLLFNAWGLELGMVSIVATGVGIYYSRIQLRESRTKSNILLPLIVLLGLLCFLGVIGKLDVGSTFVSTGVTCASIYYSLIQLPSSRERQQLMPGLFLLIAIIVVSGVSGYLYSSLMSDVSGTITAHVVESRLPPVSQVSSPSGISVCRNIAMIYSCGVIVAALAAFVWGLITDDVLSGFDPAFRISHLITGGFYGLGVFLIGGVLALASVALAYVGGGCVLYLVNHRLLFYYLNISRESSVYSDVEAVAMVIGLICIILVTLVRLLQRGLERTSPDAATRTLRLWQTLNKLIMRLFIMALVSKSLALTCRALGNASLHQIRAEVALNSQDLANLAGWILMVALLGITTWLASGLQPRRRRWNAFRSYLLRWCTWTTIWYVMICRFS